MKKRALVSLALVFLLAFGGVSGVSADEFHTVKRGETLWSIALQYGTTVQAIVAANKIEHPNLIHAGNTFVIPTESATAAGADEVRFDEPLNMTLDEFGCRTRYDDRFPPCGMIWDQSYNAGEIFVANMWAAHDHDFRSQEGCVVVYYQAPSGGGRIRFTAWDGMGFELNANSGVTLNQAIAAMRETLTRAHGCKPENIQYHQAVRHGDPVK